MAAVREVQCFYCKQKFNREELIQATKSKRICVSCNETRQKEAEDFKELIDFMCKGFRLDKPTGQQLKSIKEFKGLGYTYKDIQYTLYYIYFVEGKRVNGTSINNVPFYYEKAMMHKKLSENAAKTAIELSQKEIIIFSKDSKKPRVDRTRYIDIDSL